ncbi:hypothetical protein E2C01_096179 [Portunus trituberculatus]|uniref:Uncharacterized protein n=1 Tax=Portunus trituberculatus TaxID=210409 RepID=A0A5B7K685_PORTR|nr:hypothetical protein [Portunus trituberculatus]
MVDISLVVWSPKVQPRSLAGFLGPPVAPWRCANCQIPTTSRTHIRAALAEEGKWSVLKKPGNCCDVQMTDWGRTSSSGVISVTGAPRSEQSKTVSVYHIPRCFR